MGTLCRYLSPAPSVPVPARSASLPPGKELKRQCSDSAAKALKERVVTCMLRSASKASTERVITCALRSPDSNISLKKKIVCRCLGPGPGSIATCRCASPKPGLKHIMYIYNQNHTQQ
ncbi:uncharacterized protein LOC125241310 [Leguminivora glycinivorella]|uniref:uncharacterized protein LOC125241310 n=1 Tax=Leguminivora glycinivorella TaxID=1035111 RepID=UPI00201000BF|nr:uncharacterized protein LOC125241310 [Leguminivora glycinivorella]